MRSVKFVVEKTETGFSAYSEDFEKYPVATTGESIAELKSNILEAFNSLQEYKNKKTITAEDIAIKLDLAQFFDYYKIINAKALSERIGMNQSLLAQYVNGSKQASPKQIERIIKGVKDAAKEILELELS